MRTMHCLDTKKTLLGIEKSAGQASNAYMDTDAYVGYMGSNPCTLHQRTGDLRDILLVDLLETFLLIFKAFCAKRPNK